MSNFIETFKLGKNGIVSLTTGIPNLDVAINRIQRKKSYGIAAAPKVGKTTLTDFIAVISPYLEAERLGTLNNIEWKYFSFEIDRISKEYKFAAFFMAHDYEQYNLSYKGKIYEMSADYLMGKAIHLNADGSTERIPVSESHEKLLKDLYVNRIIPIFGEYSADGHKIRAGKIDVIEKPQTASQLYNYLLAYARQDGTFTTEKIQISEGGVLKLVDKIVGYKDNYPNKFRIIITDHIRKLYKDKGEERKQSIDNFLSYSTELRNICHFTFFHVAHSNRQVSNVERLRFMGEFIYPTTDDVKDSGNLGEECNVLLTMFNPNDEKYNLTKHFGLEIENHPNYRSLHIADARDVPCPVHIQLNMYGAYNMFTQIDNQFA